MAVIFIFVDGVGAGARDASVNPLAARDFLLSRFDDGTGPDLPRGGRAVLADATLGVAGRPQSATGQTSILTGENAPRIVGKHVLGFPNPALRELLRERSLFRDLAAAGRSAVFANAYPVAYLRALGLPCEGEVEFTDGAHRRRARASATTVAVSAGGYRLRTWSDARGGSALTHDIHGERANRFGAALPPRSPEQAAAILLRLAAAHDLAMFEFFETDEASHARDRDAALEALGRFDTFLRAVVSGIAEGDAVVVASDHGNVEDLSTRNHTRAPVPVLGFGRAAERLDSVTDLTAIAPLLKGLVL
ncbi:MAG TPA: peptidase [Anaeromyxobacteraceae bacterium]|nr:peptidase [Anaeromyxobacteraceae bacterium]